MHIFNMIQPLKKVAFPAAPGDLPNPIDLDFNNGNEIRLVNKVFACTFKENRRSTTGGSEIEQSNYVGNFSTIMRVSKSMDGDLASYCDKINETEAGIDDSSAKQIFVNNHNIDANKGQKSQLPLERIFGFSRTFEK